MLFAVDGFHTQITDMMLVFHFVMSKIRDMPRHFPSGGGGAFCEQLAKYGKK